jgi:general secretion pathway protein J
MSNNRGFTLIELLMALALLVILSGALYGTYFSVIAARDKGGQRIEARRELSTTLGALHSELASAYKARMDTKTGRTHFVVEDRDSFGKPASLLEFTYLAPPRLSQVPSSDLTLVRYAVREKEGVLTLIREARDPYLDTSVKSVPYPVMDVIEGFLVECYDGSKWVKTWDSAPGYNSRFPNLVRVTVTLKGGEVFSTIATLRIEQ